MSCEVMQLVPTSARSTNSTSGFTYPHAPPPHHQHPHAFFLDQDVARIKSEKYIQDLDSKPINFQLESFDKSTTLKMNTLHSTADSVRGGSQHDHGHNMSGYDSGIAAGAGSPYLSASHSHHHHHHHHLSASHDTISSHSVAALQRLSNTLEPSGDANQDHGSSASSYHHHSRSSVTPPPHKLRKMTQQHDEEDVGSESDVGDHHSSVSDDDVHVHGRSQYLTANCVVYTFFRGEISQVIDDHFTRALSQSASDKSKDFIPLSQRNLPASFWISNYQYPISSGSSASFSSFAHDLYHHHAHHAAAAAAAADPYSGSPLLGADVDPWQNYMAAAAGSAAYSAAHHRAAHNMYHSSRLNPQYSSFLLQSSAAMRQAHGRAAAALGKAPHDSWAAAAAVASVGSAAAGQALENYAGSTHSHYSAMPMPGLEGSMQSSSKDLYWF